MQTHLVGPPIRKPDVNSIASRLWPDNMLSPPRLPRRAVRLRLTVCAPECTVTGIVEALLFESATRGTGSTATEPADAVAD